MRLHSIDGGRVPEDDKLDKLNEYDALVKQVMALADKDTIEEVARVLAAHIGYYQRVMGRFRWKIRSPACTPKRRRRRRSRISPKVCRR
jgi:hypothetical protein